MSREWRRRSAGTTAKTDDRRRASGARAVLGSQRVCKPSHKGMWLDVLRPFGPLRAGDGSRSCGRVKMRPVPLRIIISCDFLSIFLLQKVR